MDNTTFGQPVNRLPTDDGGNSNPRAIRTINLDVAVMDVIQDRLTVADFGRISVQIARAAAAKRPSELQRLLLTIVRHRAEAPDADGAP